VFLIKIQGHVYIFILHLVWC